MGWIVFLLIIGGVIWYWKVYKASVKQLYLTLHYLDMVMLSCKTKEDFEKLLLRMYLYDNNNIVFNEFNPKWEAICEAAKVPIIKKDYGVRMFVSPVVIGLIADNIYNDPRNKRYIDYIKENSSETLTLEQLKEKAFNE